MITTAIRNITDQPIAVDFSRGRPARFPNLSINVDDDDDAAHFVDGSGDRDQFTFRPGETVRYTFAWDQQSRFTRKPVDRGVYEVIAFSNFDDRDPLKVDGFFLELK